MEYFELEDSRLNTWFFNDPFVLKLLSWRQFRHLNAWSQLRSCLELSVPRNCNNSNLLSVRDIVYLQDLVHEIRDPWNTFYHDVGDLKLMTILRCWCHLFDVGARAARRLCKKEVDIGDQNDENSYCQQHDVGNIRHQHDSKPSNLKTILFTYLQVKII